MLVLQVFLTINVSGKRKKKTAGMLFNLQHEHVENTQWEK